MDTSIILAVWFAGVAAYLVWQWWVGELSSVESGARAMASTWPHRAGPRAPSAALLPRRAPAAARSAVIRDAANGPRRTDASARSA